MSMSEPVSHNVSNGEGEKRKGSGVKELLSVKKTKKIEKINKSLTVTEIKNKENKIIRIASINLQKGIETKLEQLREIIEKNKIDIILTQEWGGWKHEEEKYEKCIKGFVNFMSFKNKKGYKHIYKSILAMGKEERRRVTAKANEGRKKGTTILVQKDLLHQFNINEIKLTKDGEIQVIEITIGKKR
jgi:hypothetical protein